MAKRHAPGESDLFTSQGLAEPLAARMRPRNLAEFIGQDHIVGEGRLLRRAIQADQLSSLIFAGPPGTGKTTLARVIANSTACGFQALNAVLAGVAEIREAIAKAQEQRNLFGRRTILFVDEVHRWNRAQQDALLPWVENGTFILIGATTENPFFEVNAALVSRSRIFRLQPLNATNLRAIVSQALQDEARGYGAYRVTIETEALDHLIDTCGGDARTLLNALELAVETTPSHFPPANPTEPIVVTRQIAEDSIQKKVVLYDKEGDYHFDTISALIKSLRGSDPDAALYWLARMVAGGEDPRYIFRRLLILASEDVGLADPQALVVVQAAATAFDRVGLPEGQFFLSQAAIYLATAPKSNSTMGYYDALAAQSNRAGSNPDVPVHLRDGNRDGEAMGHGQAYLYPHAYQDHWVAQNYLPGSLKDQIYYQPSNQGHEAQLGELVAARKWDQLALPAEAADEVFSFSPADPQLNRFIKRQEQANATTHRLIGEALSFLGCPRHGRLGLLGMNLIGWLPQALAVVPEGSVQLLVPADEVAGTTRFGQDNLPASHQGAWSVSDWSTEAVSTSRPEFGVAIVQNSDEPNLTNDLERLVAVGQTGTVWVLRLTDLLAGSRPSSAIDDPELRRLVQPIEESWLRSDAKTKNRTFDFQVFKEMADRQGLNLLEERESSLIQPIVLDTNRLHRWTDDQAGSLGFAVKAALGEATWTRYCQALSTLHDQSIAWTQRFRLLRFQVR